MKTATKIDRIRLLYQDILVKFAGAKNCTGLEAKGYVHKTVEHKEREYARGKNHINGLEEFWGYLKLAAKGGVRREYLALFLGEYVWRYNYRSLTFDK